MFIITYGLGGPYIVTDGYASAPVPPPPPPPPTSTIIKNGRAYSAIGRQFQANSIYRTDYQANVLTQEGYVSYYPNYYANPKEDGAQEQMS
jgi:hypothetical protein